MKRSVLHRSAVAGTAAMALLSLPGCVIAPPCPGPSGGSVNGDVIEYFQREWALGAAACEGGCGACLAQSCEQRVWNDDWDVACRCGSGQCGQCLSQDKLHRCFHGARRAPAVPVEPGPPGRFFPAPWGPVFDPTWRYEPTYPAGVVIDDGQNRTN